MTNTPLCITLIQAKIQRNFQFLLGMPMPGVVA
jgi:hypothetical protein